MRPLSVCLINHNGEAYLDRSLRALRESGLRLTGVAVVDDASTDGSLALVAARFPEVRVVPMPRNMGPAAARNLALRSADTDLVLLIDNDVALAPDSLDKMVEALEREPAAVTVMPTVLFGEGPTIQYDGADAHFLGQQTLHHGGMTYGSAPLVERELGSVVSACILVDRSRLPGHGMETGPGAPFDEDFFIYFEDHDFAYRMRVAGLKVLAVPTAVCYHEAGTPDLSIRVLGSYSSIRVLCHIRNRWIFIAKNYSVRTLLLLAPMLVFYEVLQFGAVVRKGWLPEWMRAVGWMIGHPRSLWRKRRHVQRNRRVPDRELLGGGHVPLREEATPSRLERSVKRALDRVAGGYWRIARRLL